MDLDDQRIMLLWELAVLESQNRKLQRRIATQRRRIARLIEIARKWKPKT